MKSMQNLAAEVLITLREKRPLILSLTNNVVQNITANMLLATGGVPVMLTHIGEINDLLQSCSGWRQRLQRKIWPFRLKQIHRR